MFLLGFCKVFIGVYGFFIRVLDGFSLFFLLPIGFFGDPVFLTTQYLQLRLRLDVFFGRFVLFGGRALTFFERFVLC